MAVYVCIYIRASQVVLVVKKLPANARDVTDMGSLPGLGRFPRGGHGNPLHSCLENPGTEESGRLSSMGSHRVRHDRSDLVERECNY